MQKWLTRQEKTMRLPFVSNNLPAIGRTSKAEKSEDSKDSPHKTVITAKLFYKQRERVGIVI
ncbi:hypothetical protein RCO48_05010 [Peribacillus frigoritolerans]|nr:hypothetical protein [Peribacillus frigoritolerans]